MKKLFIFFVVLLMTAGIAAAKDYEVSKKAGGYDVKVTIDKNPPIVGDNNLTISVKDPSTGNVSDAKVVIEYSMPAMQGMPAMNYKTDAELKGGEYKAKMTLSMAGSWNVAVKITRGGKVFKMKFSVDAY